MLRIGKADEVGSVLKWFGKARRVERWQTGQGMVHRGWNGSGKADEVRSVRAQLVALWRVLADKVGFEWVR